MTPQQIIEICQAIIDKKPVQYRSKSKGSAWYDTSISYWTSGLDFLNFEWRLKPVPREFWINIYPHTKQVSNAHFTKELAALNLQRDGVTVHVREVLDQ